MPSYNTAKYISDSIKSVISQTYSNWELLIVDDCSTDQTESVIAPFLGDKRIRYFKNSQRRGAAMSRNYALREAKGRWMAFLDSDDLWKPNKLANQISFMKKNGYSFSYTNSFGNKNGVVVTGPTKISRWGFFNYCWPGCLTVMYDAKKIGLIQIADIKKNNDYAMWLKICRKAECYLLEEELALYRRGRIGSVSTHSVGTLIKWHYKLFRISEEQNQIQAIFNTLRNIVFGFYKKLRYVKQL